MPKCKAARERNDMGRQDIFACPVELSGEGHDRSLAAEADIISAVRPEIATARIQSDDASARVHHMSVAVERQNPIGAAVDEEQSVVPADPQPTRIDDARIAAENANRLTIVGKRDNFSIASAVCTGRTCDEESHVSLGTYSKQDLLALQLSMAAIGDFAESILSKRAQAAVDDEIGAGNVAALVGSQEQRRGSNLLGAAKAV